MSALSALSRPSAAHTVERLGKGIPSTHSGYSEHSGGVLRPWVSWVLAPYTAWQEGRGQSRRGTGGLPRPSCPAPTRPAQCTKAGLGVLGTSTRHSEYSHWCASSAFTKLIFFEFHRLRWFAIGLARTVMSDIRPVVYSGVLRVPTSSLLFPTTRLPPVLRAPVHRYLRSAVPLFRIIRTVISDYPYR